MQLDRQGAVKLFIVILRKTHPTSFVSQQPQRQSTDLVEVIEGTPNRGFSTTEAEEAVPEQSSNTLAPRRAGGDLGYAERDQPLADLAYYRGTIVTVKHLHRQHIQVTRQVKLEFKEVSLSAFSLLAFPCIVSMFVCKNREEK